MKRLKYACPFGGKKYPGLTAAAVSVTIMFVCIFHAATLSGFAVIALPLLAAAVVLAGCWWWEHRLTNDEERLIESAETPLWSPLTPELSRQVREDESGMRVSIPGAIVCGIIVGALVAVIAGTGILERHHSRMHPELFLPCFLIGALITTGALFFRSLIAATWEGMDESAVYTVIPIHHMYDVQHQSSGRSSFIQTEGRTWFETYYVCYLPDGRYTLHAKYSQNGSPAKEIVVIKYRNLLRWQAR